MRLTKFALVAAVFIWASGVACAFDETADPWIRGVFTGRSPRAISCGESDAWREAIDLVSRTPGAFILQGTGQSMMPLYPPGTLLVIQETNFADLRSGQTVIYRNERQRAVGHVLVAKARDGWRARGLNNYTHDGEPVTESKVIGVVIAAYAPPSTPAPRTAQRRISWATFQSDSGR